MKSCRFLHDPQISQRQCSHEIGIDKYSVHWILQAKKWYSISNNLDGMWLCSTSSLGVYWDRRWTFWTCTGLRKFNGAFRRCLFWCIAACSCACLWQKRARVQSLEALLSVGTAQMNMNRVSQIDVYTLWNVISQQLNGTNTICVVLYSLNFLKPIHVQNVHLLPQYTANNDVEHSDIPSGLLLIEYNFWARKGKIRWTLDFSIPISREHCLNDFFGDRAKTYISTLVISITSLSSAPTFQHI